MSSSFAVEFEDGEEGEDAGCDLVLLPLGLPGRLVRDGSAALTDPTSGFPSGLGGSGVLSSLIRFRERSSGLTS